MKWHFVAGLPFILTGAGGQDFTAQFPLDEIHFSVFGGNPYFILDPGHRQILEGNDGGQQIVVTITALNQTKPVTLPSSRGPRVVMTRVVEERETVDGVLDEVARLWYARSLETGDVYLFGEESDFYFDGAIVGQARLWEAGVDGALPGIIMPRTFLLAARYYQNQAPSALDGAENIAMGLTITTPAGTFSNCVQTLETDQLRPDLDPTTKTYAPGVGLINDDSVLQLTDHRLGTVGLPTGCSFTPSSNHPYSPISPGRRLVFEGLEQGRPASLTVTVLDQIRSVTVNSDNVERLIPARVIEERKMVEGELVEVSRRLLAQCLETGDVHCLGREVDQYLNGVIIGHEKSWFVGMESAQAGIFMPANLTPGARFLQTTAPGVAIDEAVNAAIGISLAVPAGNFSNCVRIVVRSLVETNTEALEITYAPGLGMISYGKTLKLVSFNLPDVVSNSPILSVQDAVLLSWPYSDTDFTPQRSADLQSWFPIPQTPLPVEGRNQLSLPRDRSRSFFRLTAP